MTSTIIAPRILDDKDFDRLSTFIYSNYGIKMPISKKTMLQARLQNRLKDLNFSSFKQYVDFVFTDKAAENEIVKMIDVVSTNKTDFFREPKHFDFMKETILPQFHDKKLKVWSSASSSGEEAYTIAITVEEYAKANKSIDYAIFGTDISSRIIEKAINGVYTEDRISGMSLEMKKKYFLKSKNRETPLVKVVPELRTKTAFARLNLMDNSYQGIPTNFDVIFCRNVLIYFDRPTQEKVINKLCNHLNTGGYFMLGHSESVMGLSVPLKQIMPTVFTKI